MNLSERNTRTMNRIKTAGCLITLFNMAIVVAVIVGVLFLLTHPAVIGTFFGTIVHAFNSAK